MPGPWNAERGEQEILTFVKSYSGNAQGSPKSVQSLDGLILRDGSRRRGRP